MAEYWLDLDILTFWRAGTGQGRRFEYNESCARDPLGLPWLPGRTVKGLLRHALETLEGLEADASATRRLETEPLSVRLFGRRPPRRGRDLSRGERADLNVSRGQPGLARVSGARLPLPVRQALEETRAVDPVRFAAMRDALFTTLHATALDEGRARARSLRVMEVAVPMLLRARLELPGAEDARGLEAALPLVRSLGSGRRRGLGRVVARLHPARNEEE